MVARGTLRPQEARDRGRKVDNVAVGVTLGRVAEIIRVEYSLLLPDERV